ncbi:cytochrome c oxidase subunit COX9 [Colletotrichum lupini]|uniref:Cytochrome c oxidase subunit COX9 n=1 Tax=Colletotrichum lupini TaxID=145971 RepID=A0A9Q8WA80_9PEZI|nr:cytochrome c oxidase subunit COX9 [Colletotrichum lupini]UQC75909.1 cytochrome c oxidase subunit COX9 [Colletotrichum lupini]
MAGATAVKPITGMLRRNLVLDLGIALGKPFSLQRFATPVFNPCFPTQSENDSINVAFTGLGFAMANVYWYGFHMPRTNARDSYYAKLEQQKAEARKA